MAAETSDLLSQSGLSVGHQFLVTAIPQLIPMTEGPRHTAAGRLNGVLGHQLRIQGRQLAVPIDGLGVVAVVAVVHAGTEPASVARRAG